MNSQLLAILVGVAVYCLMSKKPNNERLMWAVGAGFIIYLLVPNCYEYLCNDTEIKLYKQKKNG